MPAACAKEGAKTIALVLPDVSNSYFAQVINCVQSIAHDKGYQMLIYLTGDSHIYEEAILNDLVMTGRADGVVISISSETTNSASIKTLQSKGVPIIFVGRSCDDIETAKITTNDMECGAAATEHLIENGCLRIAMVTISGSLSVSHQRIDGYKAALTKRNIAVDEGLIIHRSNNESLNEQLVQDLLQLNKPDGIIVTGERLTIKLYTICHALHLKIPDDIKVVSFSNIASAGVMSPSLTTIAQPAYDMGKKAAMILFRALENKEINLVTESVLIPSTLHVRRSTISTHNG